MNIKKLSFFGIFILLGILVWYLFVKSYDYKITFESKQSPGVIYSSLVAWNNWEPKSKKTVSVLSKIPFSNVVQEFKVSDSIFKIEWLLTKKSDSITKITALLSDKDHSLIQRIKMPFTKTDFMKRVLSTVKNIRKGIRAHKSDYKVSNVTEAIIPEKNVAYIELNCKLHEKANKMMMHTIDAMEYIKMNNMKLTDDPFIEIVNWNLQEDHITFHFCFPIPKLSTYPKSDVVNIKTTVSKPAIKTTFNGHYKFSDRGWFYLLDYAKTHKIDIEELPVEVFLNDPHSGEDELNWEAEIYLPLKRF